MPNITFAWWPAIFLLLAVIPMALFLGQRQKNASFLHASLALVLAQISPSPMFGKPRLRIPWWALCLFVLLVLALMRPQFVGKPIELRRDGRSIMLVLDISESMDTPDLEINGKNYPRLSIAKSVLAQFIDHRKNDRIGLVVFGSESFLHAPLSFDHETIKRFLLETRAGFAGPKTAIGDAIGLAVKKLAEADLKDRILILLTDGQNNTGMLTPEQAAGIAQKQGVKMYIVGVGASSMSVQGFFGQSRINPSEELDQAEPELQRLAQMTGGQYFRAKDSHALSEIYEQIDKFEPTPAEPLVIIPKKELFTWPLFLLLILLLMRFFVAAFSSRREVT